MEGRVCVGVSVERDVFLPLETAMTPPYAPSVVHVSIKDETNCPIVVGALAACIHLAALCQASIEG